MGWDKPVFTDSGGFQVFSLGFGTDHGMGKILQEETQKNITTGTESQKVKIKEEGVSFRSPKDGSQLFLSPEISIDLQEHIGADVMFAFDECPSPLSTYEYMKDSIARTHRWAERCLAARTTDQALYGIVQGGSFPDLRRESAQILGAMSERGGFNGFGIGGEFGYDKASLRDNTLAATSNLPAHLPRHLLGVGHPEDFDYIAEGGADTFDCIAPTHYARHGTAFTSVGRIDLTKASMLEDLTPIDPSCTCPTCSTYTRSYVSHLIKSHEHTGIKLATVHNVHYFNMLAKRLRERILNDEL
jgi:tRNA-guanine family transglycosylase